MNGYKIRVQQARRWFGGRAQWRFSILAPNGTDLSDRDTYANVGDIETAMKSLVNSDRPVTMEVHYRSGVIERTSLR